MRNLQLINSYQLTMFDFIKGAMHRHSPGEGFFEALFFTGAVLVASSSCIQLSFFFT